MSRKWIRRRTRVKGIVVETLFQVIWFSVEKYENVVEINKKRTNDLKKSVAKIVNVVKLIIVMNIKKCSGNEPEDK